MEWVSVAVDFGLGVPGGAVCEFGDGPVDVFAVVLEILVHAAVVEILLLLADLAHLLQQLHLRNLVVDVALLPLQSEDSRLVFFAFVLRL